VTWEDVLARLPLIAILRGAAPREAVDIAEALAEAGLLCVEVTLNSPDPLHSIAAIRDRFDGRLLVGAGTVLRPDEVEAAVEAGAELIISPNADLEVIKATKAADLTSLPGVFTPTEAFAALAAGADALKLFPAEAAPPAVLKAMLAVLPAGTTVFPVGGVEPQVMANWRAAGAVGFGIGGALYRPGRTLAEIRARAEAFVAAWRAG
jgi:2-dehydro-3-deoxyphosphogalactonate aldolase